MIGLVPVFTAVKAPIFPVPAAAKPIPGVSLVQVYEVVPPVFVVAKLIAANELPLHIVLWDTVVTLAAGFTVIVKVIGVPLQLLEFEKIGVTVIVALTGAFPVLVAINEGMSPVPLAANPMEVAVLVQLKVVVPPVF
jgi:hypothetical protein